MTKLFPLKASLTAEQDDVLNADPDLIISGAAGTGKTYLTILLAERLTSNYLNNTIAIIILTTSLKKFIKHSLKERNIQRTDVFYHYEWIASLRAYDFIIIDEAQDFTIKQIVQIKTFCRKGIYILGDTNQRILEKNNSEKTATMEEIRVQLRVPEKILTQNLRFHEGIKDFICEAYPGIQITTATSARKSTPQIIRCKSKEDEISKMMELLKSKSLTGTIAILVHKNDEVLEIVQGLKSKGFTDLGYKYKQEEKLFFINSIANILTYHSSKGLEFDCVLLPFLSVGSGIPNLLYVALSRARERLILLYSVSFTPDLKLNNKNVYEGIIEKPYVIDEAETNILLYNTILDMAKQTNDKSYINQTKEEHKDMLNEAIEQLKNAGLSKAEISKYFDDDILL